MEDKLLIVVFPSVFSQNKIKSLITNIRKILKIQNQKFAKIRKEGEVIVVDADDPVFASTAINTLFGIKRVAIAKQVDNNFESIVEEISNVGVDLFLNGERFLIQVEGYAKGFIPKDVEIAATSSLIEKTKKEIKPGTNEKFDGSLYVYLTKPHAYICIYYDKGLEGIPNNSQNKKIVCCIFDELSAVSCLETMKQGFDVKIVIYYTKESELLRLVKIVNQIIHRTVKSKINLEFYKISPGLPIMLLTEVTIELLSRIAKLNGIKRISLSLSTLIHPIEFLEEMVMRVYNETLIPYLPLSGLDTNILESAKEIGLDKYSTKIKKNSKSMYHNAKQSRKKPEKIAEQAIMTRKNISIKMGANNVHDILDIIRSKQ